MEDLIKRFPEQLEEAMAIGRKVALKPPVHVIWNIIVTGLGGSGIGGNLTRELAAGGLQVPFLVNKNYHIPAFTGEHTLVIASSYSGNTEETLSAAEEALRAGAQIVCVTSGGKLVEWAASNGLDTIRIPGGMPPRSCLGYSFVQQMYILRGLRLWDHDFEPELKAAIQMLKKEQEAIKKAAEDLAVKLEGFIPVIYATTAYEAAAIRMRQQLNENAKMLCWHHVIPEMNHNELVGWRGERHNMAVVMLRGEDDFARNRQRMELIREDIERCGASVYDVVAEGRSRLERTLFLIHLIDWASLHLSRLNGVDVMEVAVIDKLKAALAKL